MDVSGYYLLSLFEKARDSVLMFLGLILEELSPLSGYFRNIALSYQLDVISEGSYCL